MFILFEGVTVSEEVALFRGKGKETTERERGGGFGTLVVPISRVEMPIFS